MLRIQCELQETQLRQAEHNAAMLQRQDAMDERLDRLVDTAERNSQAIALLINVVTVHQDSMEQLKRTVDYLLAKDGGDRECFNAESFQSQTLPSVLVCH